MTALETMPTTALRRIECLGETVTVLSLDERYGDSVLGCTCCAFEAFDFCPHTEEVAAQLKLETIR